MTKTTDYSLPENRYGTPEYFARMKDVPISEFIWQAKSSYETRYYQTEEALTKYFGSMAEAEKSHVITKYRKA
jgi:hypothetical protein